MHKFLTAIIICCFCSSTLASETTVGHSPPKGSVEKHSITSRALTKNLIDVNPKREISIYLPPGYQTAERHFPVIYYIPFSQQTLEPVVTALFDRAIARGDIGEFILVTGDFSTPHSINFFGNNEVTGRWLDYIKEELVPWVDQRYRTLKSAEHRGISGHFLGGFAAIKLAMLYPDTFSSVYALHPVATGTGERTMLWVPNWKEIHSAEGYADLKAPYSSPFVAMAQAHLPNPKRPPFYADFIVEDVNGEPTPHPAHIYKLMDNFMLDALVPKYWQNLQDIKAIGFDWGRNDANQAHVYANRKFAVLLEDYGLSPETVEHRGNGWDYDFSIQGHINMRMLPFFARYLKFQ